MLKESQIITQSILHTPTPVPQSRPGHSPTLANSRSSGPYLGAAEATRPLPQSPHHEPRRPARSLPYLPGSVPVDPDRLTAWFVWGRAPSRALVGMSLILVVFLVTWVVYFGFMSICMYGLGIFV